MFQIPNGPELIFIIALALIIFGPKRLPEIGKTIGKGIRELRNASREITDAFDFRETLSSLSDEDTPKENEHNDSEHNAVPGLADHHSGDNSTVRSEEVAGTGQVDG